MTGPAADSPRSWRAGARAVLVELVYLALSLLAGAVAVALAMLVGALPDPQLHAWSAFVAGPAMMGVAVATYALLERRGRYSRDASRAVGVRGAVAPLVPARERPSGKSAMGMTVVAVAVALSGSALIAFALDAVGWEVEEQEAVLRIVRGGWSLDFAALIFAAVALAPIAEEALFRGHLFRRLHLHAGLWPAHLASALVFALVHGNVSGVLTYAWLAVCFAEVYRRTGRLWTAMLVHFGNNAMTLSLLLLLPE